MTFCIGVKVEKGLVGLSDTRLTSGAQYSTAPKTTIIQRDNHSMFIMTSGLRSARDKALTYFNEMLETEDASFSRMYVAANKIIGGSGFGTPILRRVLTYQSSPETALKLVILAFDPTRISANDVGYPIDVVHYRKGSYSLTVKRFEAEDLSPISAWWQNVQRRSVSRMPSSWIRSVTG